MAITSDQHRLLEEYVRASQIRLRPAFLERVASHRIRDCHGDLRTSAVCFDPACPEGMCIFDCIEFSRRFRCGDVASEIAFLSMDLESRGRSDLASSFVEAYEQASGDSGLRRLLPFYSCYRAYVRGKVEGLRSRETEVGEVGRQEALNLARISFNLACRYAQADRPPLLIFMSGLSATGKTTVAHQFAERLGATLLSSDVVRRELRGHPDHSVAPYGVGLYSDRGRRAIYDELRARAAALLARGESVILDATFGERARRDEVRATASEQGAYCFAVECHTDEAIIRERMALRDQGRDGSDSRSRASAPTWLNALTSMR